MLSKIHIGGFRTEVSRSVECTRSTYIEGKNGSGKTHILEGVHLLCQGSLSYSTLPPNHGSLFSITWESDIGSTQYTRYRDGKSDIYSIGGKKISRTQFIRELPFRTVFISPFDMNLLYFAPSLRRDYIDGILEQRYEQFAQIKKEYDEVMKQRNALLKQIREGKSQRKLLDFWDTKFANCAEKYLIYRETFFSYIQSQIELLTQYHRQYSLKFQTHLTTEKSNKREGMILASLQEQRERDILSGHTHIGPHRDDFSFEINQNDDVFNVTDFLSRGEIKLLLLSLKTLECLFLQTREEKKIILLVDDIFAELDEENICRFLKSLTTYQTILTSQKPLPNGQNWSEFTCINLKDT